MKINVYICWDCGRMESQSEEIDMEILILFVITLAVVYVFMKVRGYW